MLARDYNNLFKCLNYTIFTEIKRYINLIIAEINQIKFYVKEIHKLTTVYTCRICGNLINETCMANCVFNVKLLSKTTVPLSFKLITKIPHCNLLMLIFLQDSKKFYKAQYKLITEVKTKYSILYKLLDLNLN